MGTPKPELQVASLWPTLVFSAEPGEPTFPRELLLRGILAERATSPGLVRSNRGGWHSVPDLALRPDPVLRAAIAHLMGAVEAAAEAFVARVGVPLPVLRPRVQAWAMVLERGHHVILHDHAEADWSVAWYVDAGDDPASGTITFVDVRRVRSPIPGVDADPSHFTIRPRTGQILVFPGWLPHVVDPYAGERPRVVVSANVRYER